jgi:protein-disulfide isomerase
MTTIRLAAAAATLAALLAVPAAAFDITAMSDAERAAFRAEIRSFLLENPEIMLDVQDELQARQDAAQSARDAEVIAQNSAALLDDGVSFVGGNPAGSITVVEFIDYRCGYCRKAHSEVAELVRSDGDIRYVVKEFPILGEESLLASRFAIAVLRVAGPEAYARVNKGFYGDFRGEVTPATLDAFAASLDLDPAAIRKGMEDPGVLDVIRANHALAEALEISGTPSFVMGDTLLRGYVPLDAMQAIVGAERKG